jgi:methionine-rich copper-binding protein CopC
MILVRWRVLALGMLAAVVAAVLTAGPAFAHTSLKSSNPASGATVPTAPTAVTLTFGEAVGLPATPVRIAAADGTPWAIGKVSASGATVTAPVTAAGPAGPVTVRWSVVADDGDTVSGTFTFTVAAAPTTAATTSPPSPTPAPTSAAAPATTSAAPAPDAAGQNQGGGIPAWVWIVIAVVVVGGGAAVVAARRRAGGGGER